MRQLKISDLFIEAMKGKLDSAQLHAHTLNLFAQLHIVVILH